MSPEIIVRNYRSDDFGDLKQILFGYRSPTGRVWSEGMVEEVISDALREQADGVFVAEIGGRVIGFAIVMHRTWFNAAYLDYIQVKTEWTNKGVGGKLIEKCKDWARKKGSRIIYTETGKDNEGVT